MRRSPQLDVEYPGAANPVNGMLNPHGYVSVMDAKNNSTGHSKQLRERLRIARDAKGMTQQQVADGIAARLGKESLTGAAVSAWEKFDRHPPIDVMAA